MIKSKINKALHREAISASTASSAPASTSVSTYGLLSTERTPLLEVPVECRLLIFQQLFLNFQVEIYVRIQDYGNRGERKGKHPHGRKLGKRKGVDDYKNGDDDHHHYHQRHDDGSEFLFKIRGQRNAAIFLVSKQLCLEAKEAFFRETAFLLRESPIDLRVMLIKRTPLPERVVSQLQCLMINVDVVNQLILRLPKFQARFSGLKHLIVLTGCRHIYDADYNAIKRLINHAPLKTTVFLSFILNDIREDSRLMRDANTEMKLLLQGKTAGTKSIYNHDRPVFRNIKITIDKGVKRKEEWEDLQALYFIVQSLGLDRSAVLADIGFEY